MKLLSKFKRGLQDNGMKNIVWDEAKKYYDFVTVYDNTDRYDRSYDYPVRMHIRTDVITNDLIYDLEQLGFECQSGTTCNEWETSMQVRRDNGVKIHPPHMPITIKTPTKLSILAPQWDNFLVNVKYLGHLLGTLSNGISVPKQAFGECDTSIVLETYKRAFGEEDYKSHQCNECINFELGFKKSIEGHDMKGFEDGLVKYVEHFTTIHKDLFAKMKEKPEVNSKVKRFQNIRGMGRLPHGFLD